MMFPTVTAVERELDYGNDDNSSLDYAHNLNVTDFMRISMNSSKREEDFKSLQELYAKNSDLPGYSAIPFSLGNTTSNTPSLFSPSDSATSDESTGQGLLAPIDLNINPSITINDSDLNNGDYDSATTASNSTLNLGSIYEQHNITDHSLLDWINHGLLPQPISQFYPTSAPANLIYSLEQQQQQPSPHRSYRQSSYDQHLSPQQLQYPRSASFGPDQQPSYRVEVVTKNPNTVAAGSTFNSPPPPPSPAAKRTRRGSLSNVVTTKVGASIRPSLPRRPSTGVNHSKRQRIGEQSDGQWSSRTDTNDSFGSIPKNARRPRRSKSHNVESSTIAPSDIVVSPILSNQANRNWIPLSPRSYAQLSASQLPYEPAAPIQPQQQYTQNYDNYDQHWSQPAYPTSAPAGWISNFDNYSNAYPPNSAPASISQQSFPTLVDDPESHSYGADDSYSSGYNTDGTGHSNDELDRMALARQISQQQYNQLHHSRSLHFAPPASTPAPNYQFGSNFSTMMDSGNQHSIHRSRSAPISTGSFQFFTQPGATFSQHYSPTLSVPHNNGFTRSPSYDPHHSSERAQIFQYSNDGSYRAGPGSSTLAQLMHNTPPPANRPPKKSLRQQAKEALAMAGVPTPKAKKSTKTRVARVEKVEVIKVKAAKPARGVSTRAKKVVESEPEEEEEAEDENDVADDYIVEEAAVVALPTKSKKVKAINSRRKVSLVPAAGFGGMFVNFSAMDSEKLLTGVAPSGNSKRRRGD